MSGRVEEWEKNCVLEFVYQLILIRYYSYKTSFEKEADYIFLRIGYKILDTGTRQLTKRDRGTR